MMNLTDIRVIRSLMEAHGISFQKKFGQNFLTNPTVITRIAAAAAEMAGEDPYILEIGPGIGCLTHELCQKAKQVVSVEIDTGLIPVLHETLADCSNFTLVHGDIMKVNLHELVETQFGGNRFSVCANLPYNITTPILMRLLEENLPIDAITIMIQREVADRFCALPGSDAYGAVTAVLSYYGHAEKLFPVSAGNFTPVPKVDSTVIRITMYDRPPVKVCDKNRMMRVIRAAFEQRRKTMRNAINALYPQLTKEQIGQIIASCGYAEDIRGERLGIADFAKITDALEAFSKQMSIQ